MDNLSVKANWTLSATRWVTTSTRRAEPWFPGLIRRMIRPGDPGTWDRNMITISTSVPYTHSAYTVININIIIIL